MKRLITALVLALPMATAEAQQGLTPQDLDDLKRVSDYLNGLQSVEGRFAQIAANGSFAEGRFFLRKPGRMRFEYDPPVNVTIVADGLTVAITNADLETQDRYPLVETPLSLLLEDRVDLTQNEAIVDVERSSGQLAITARETDGLAQGEITLFFSDPGLELRHWVITDAEGETVTVALSDVKRDVNLGAELFVIKDPDAAIDRPD